jgi:RNA polymerase sigma-70 factor (ECF subfamily)
MERRADSNRIPDFGVNSRENGTTCPVPRARTVAAENSLAGGTPDRMTRDLVERAMHGDQEAFGMLAERSLDRLVGTAGLILRDADAAQDATQDALIRAWRDLPRLRDPDRFSSWLYRLLVNSCRDHWRRQKRHAHRALEPEHAGASLDAVQAMADRDALTVAIDRLSEAHRAVVVLHYYAGLSHHEIATATGDPLGTVKSRLSRAVSYLRADLAATERAPVRSEGSA